MNLPMAPCSLCTVSGSQSCCFSKSVHTDPCLYNAILLIVCKVYFISCTLRHPRLCNTCVDVASSSVFVCSLLAYEASGFY